MYPISGANCVKPIGHRCLSGLNIIINVRGTACIEMSDAAARFVWKLARRHSWGSPIPPVQLIQLVARTEDHDELASTLEDEVLKLSFVVQSPEGVYIPNGQDAHLKAANWLREQTEFDDLTIKATLSRLPSDWPRDE